MEKDKEKFSFSGWLFGNLARKLGIYEEYQTNLKLRKLKRQLRDENIGTHENTGCDD